MSTPNEPTGPRPEDLFGALFGGPTPAPREPNATIREGAAEMFELYTGFVAAGFSADQALELLKAVLMRAAG